MAIIFCYQVKKVQCHTFFKHSAKIFLHTYLLTYVCAALHKARSILNCISCLQQPHDKEVKLAVSKPDGVWRPGDCPRVRRTIIYTRVKP